MKNTAMLTALVSLFCALIFTNCKKDDPAPERDAFLGAYTAQEACEGSDQQAYPIRIEADAANETGVVLWGINDSEDISVTATVAGNQISIPEQPYIVPILGELGTIRGNGKLEGQVLTIDYAAEFFGFPVSCTVTCTKN